MNRPAFEEILQRVNNAIRILFIRDSFLLINKVHERSISHKFAEYLEMQFPDWDIDCEYNKKGDATKKLLNIPACSQNNDYNEHSVYPDIIIHQRNTDNNLLVIEIKTSNKKSICDFEKLKQFTSDPEFKYSYGLFIRFKGIHEHEIKRFENGEELI